VCNIYLDQMSSSSHRIFLR